MSILLRQELLHYCILGLICPLYKDDYIIYTSYPIVLLLKYKAHYPLRMSAQVTKCVRKKQIC